MKVGTDGVLLGAWCNVGKASRIMDVGTGTGLIALMVAQRNSTALIDAIEINKDAYTEALYNVSQSPWHDRVNVINADFTQFKPNACYDLIISNPPYFTNGVLPPDKSRLMARHCETLTYETLISHASTMLTPNGRLCMITPLDVEPQVAVFTDQCGLSVIKKTYVRPKPSAMEKRILWEMTPLAGPIIIDELVIENETHHAYTPEYIALTKDFYLKM